MLLRSAQNSDLDAIYHLAEKSGIGMTTLPQNKSLLKERIEWASTSFKKELKSPEHEYYLFVLEHNKNNEIVGVSAIESKTGQKVPFYSYKISKSTQISPSLNIRNDYEVLNLVNDHQGCSEICTLFLNPQFRKNNNGLLLSKGRFLFMAQYPERLSSKVIAEMRGVSNEGGISPFWEDLGRHFFHMSYAEADKLTLATNKQFIADLMPRTTIYVKLLSPEAQAAIGKAHPSTVPAMNILLQEGFFYNKYIDIFDAGPTLEAPINTIKTIKSSQLLTIKSLSDSINTPNYLLSNTELNFRATISSVLINQEDNNCIINNKTAELLNVQQGDLLRISPL